MIFIMYSESIVKELLEFFYAFYLVHSPESATEVYKPSFQIHPKPYRIEFMRWVFLLVKPDWIWNETF